MSEQQSGSASNPELEAAILSNPDRADAYLVYGDWLQHQGHPRGELIALQHAAQQASEAEAGRLNEQVNKHIQRHEGVLLQGLTEAIHHKTLTVDWQLGYIRSARVNLKRYDIQEDLPGLVKVLLTHPSARFIRELTLGKLTYGVTAPYDGVFSALIEAGSNTLQHLSIGSAMNAAFPALSPLGEALPALRVLKLRGSYVELGDIHLPELREFTLEADALPLPAVKAIAQAKWPRLERLEVSFGQEEYGAAGGVEDIQPLLEGKGLPSLKHLGLRKLEFTKPLARALPRSEVLPRLETLDLSLGRLNDEDAEFLAANARAFQHLKHLDLSYNLLSPRGVKQVETLCPDVACANQRDYEYVEDRDGRRRFVPVGE